MADSESSDSPQAKLLFECSQALQAKDMDTIAKYLHKDFRVVCYPRSLGIPDHTKEDWLERWAGIISLQAGDIDVSYVGCSTYHPLPSLSSSCSINSVSSQTLQENLSFTFVSRTSGSTISAYST